MGKDTSSLSQGLCIPILPFFLKAKSKVSKVITLLMSFRGKKGDFASSDPRHFFFNGLNSLMLCQLGRCKGTEKKDSKYKHKKEVLGPPIPTRCPIAAETLV